MKTRKPITPAEPPPILRPLANSTRLNQMLIQQLQRALHHSDAVEGMLILPFIERTAGLRNDLARFLEAIKERRGDNH